MTRNRNNNGEVTNEIKDMAPPLPDTELSHSRFWFFDFLISTIIITVLTIGLCIKNSFLYFFKQKKSIKGQVVVITGSGRGLGRAIALKLSKLGAKIICVDINTKTNEETAQLIRQEGGKADAFTVNIGKLAQIEQFSKDVINKFGQVDILINNAALAMGVPLDEITNDDIKATCEINIMAAMFLINAFLPDMRKRNKGHIVSVSSLASILPSPWLALYCATKAALTRFMDVIQVELNYENGNEVKITTVHPAFLNTTADYYKFIRMALPIYPEDDAANDVVDGILYDKKSICVPSTYTPLYYLNGLMPYHFVHLIVKCLARSLSPPTKKDRDQLPYSTIVKDTVSEKQK